MPEPNVLTELDSGIRVVTERVPSVRSGALGLWVVPTDGRRHVGFGRAAVRCVLIALVIPPLITDTDLRGLQDRMTATAVVRR